MSLFPLSPALKNMALYGISIVLMKGVSLFMLPYIANHIPQYELGRLELLATFAMILSVVLGFSLHEALYRFAGAEQDPHKKKKNNCTDIHINHDCWGSISSYYLDNESFL